MTEFKAKLDEALLRCEIVEDPRVTVSRFRTGLRTEIQHELIPHLHHDLDQAVAVEIERAQKARRTTPQYRGPSTVRFASPSTRPPTPFRPTSTTPSLACHQTMIRARRPVLASSALAVGRPGTCLTSARRRSPPSSSRMSQHRTRTMRSPVLMRTRKYTPLSTQVTMMTSYMTSTPSQSCDASSPSPWRVTGDGPPSFTPTRSWGTTQADY